AMARRPRIQQNPYEGNPPRPWISLQIITSDGDVIPAQLLADTGNPYAIIVSHKVLELARVEEGPAFKTNFGLLDGGWIRIVIPELKVDQELMAFANEPAVELARASWPHLDGLAG